MLKLNRYITSQDQLLDSPIRGNTLDVEMVRIHIKRTLFVNLMFSSRSKHPIVAKKLEGKPD